MAEMKYVVKENNEWKVVDTPTDGAIPFKKIEIKVSAYETEFMAFAFKNKNSVKEIDDDCKLDLINGFIQCDAKDSACFWEIANMFIDDEDVTDNDMEFDGYDEPENFCNDDYEVVVKTIDASKVCTTPIEVFVPDIEYGDERLCFTQPFFYDNLFFSPECFDDSEELKNLWPDDSYSYDEVIKIMKLLNGEYSIQFSDHYQEFYVPLEMDCGDPKIDEIKFYLKNDDDEWDEFESLEDLKDAL